jgi:hypothetical protein
MFVYYPQYFLILKIQVAMMIKKNKPTRIESFEILVRYLSPRFEKFEGSVGTVVFKKVYYGDQKILAVTILTFTKCK